LRRSEERRVMLAKNVLSVASKTKKLKQFLEREERKKWKNN
jgi:hypothetical protein